QGSLRRHLRHCPKARTARLPDAALRAGLRRRWRRGLRSPVRSSPPRRAEGGGESDGLLAYGAASHHTSQIRVSFRSDPRAILGAWLTHSPVPTPLVFPRTTWTRNGPSLA